MKTFIIVLLAALTSTIHAQNWMTESGVVEGDDFYTIQSKGHAYFEANPEKKAQQTFSGFQYDSQYKRFRRWEHYWKDRVMTDGSFPNLPWSEYQNNIKIARRQNGNQRAAWVNINQTQPGTITGYDGMGRTTSIAFHPTDSDTYIVSGAVGGIWLTTDDGINYTDIGFNLPYMAIGDVGYHSQNTSTIYVATGDPIWYGLPSMGVLKSTDMGATWQTTGLTFNLNLNVRINKLLVDPNNGDIVYAATGDGLHKTIDGGTTWTQIRSGFHWDVIFKPGTSTTLYALGEENSDLEIFKTTNAGSSFTPSNSLALTLSRFNTSFLAVSSNDPNVVYCLSGSDNTLYKSSDSGSTFTLVNSATPSDDGLAVSNADADNVYVGALDNYRSNNSGGTFTQKSNWYNNNVTPVVHADTRRMLTNPLKPNRIYVCNDGGIYFYDEINDSWTERSAGLIITQYYSVASAQTNVDRVSAGSQDNGTRIRNNDGTWRALNGGDGMDVAIDALFQDILYCTYINGTLYRSLDGWNNDTYNDITPNASSSNWVTRYVLDPSDNSTIVGAYNEVFYSTNRGDSWIQISNLNVGDLTDVSVSAADPNYIYTCLGTVIYYTDDLGLNWNNRFVPATNSITSIATNPTNTEQFWVSLSGYNSSKKVYFTDDNGLSWTNMSNGLPNVPVNKIIYQNGGNGILYAGTDMGMYSWDGSAWQPMNQGLPLTQVLDIDIQYSAGKIRIGTHGRGVFETDILDPLLSIDNHESTDFKLYPNPIGTDLLKLELYNLTSQIQMEIRDIQGKLMQTQNVGNGVTGIDVSGLAAGIYTIILQGDNQFTTQKLVKK